MFQNLFTLFRQNTRSDSEVSRIPVQANEPVFPQKDANEYMRWEDVDIISISTSTPVQYAGYIYHGLSDLLEASYESYQRMAAEPYIVRRTESYPCFDSSDYAYENRFYQTFFFTTLRAKADGIYKEEKNKYNGSHERKLYPVLDPTCNRRQITRRMLPYIYYQGEGNTMLIVQDVNARPGDRITQA